MIIGTDDKARTNSERKLVVKLWEILEGEKRNGIALSDLKTVISCIACSISGGKAQSSKGFGKYVNDVYTVTKAEADELHKYFKLFYLNKIAKKKTLPKHETSFMHNPTISASSTKMANKIREEWQSLGQNFGPADNKKVNLSLAEILVTVRKKAQEHQPAEKKKDSKKENKNNLRKENQKNTGYKPKAGCSYRMHKQLAPEKKTDKCLELFNCSRILRKKADKSTEEVEYQRQKKELTFQPNAQR